MSLINCFMHGLPNWLKPILKCGNVYLHVYLMRRDEYTRLLAENISEKFSCNVSERDS